MQTLPSLQYNALDSLVRNPNATVTIKRNYNSIPFEGKQIQSTVTNEKTPKHILHSDGRLCLVYSKYVTADIRTQIYYKFTDTNRETWGTSVKLTTGTIYNYYAPACIQINNSTNIGIIMSRNDTDLYSMIIDSSGIVQVSLTDTTFKGTNPSLSKIGTVYWLFYERSGVIYYRTCTDFSTWGAENNFNTITGLSNNHGKPYAYYDSSNKFWVTFERVSDPLSNPVVCNAYYITSDDDGLSWNSPIAQTSLVAGDGSAVQTSIVDTTEYRYFSYTLEQNIQSYQDSFGDTNKHNFFVDDSVNNRVGMITGQAYASGYYLCIYDRDTATYTNHNITTYMTQGYVNCLAYDDVNQLWVIGTSNDGLIVYDEINITWKVYNKSSTPSILGYNIIAQKMVVENSIIYFVSFDSGASYSYDMQMLNLTTGVNTEIGSLTNPNIPYTWETFVSSNYIIEVIRANNMYGYSTYHPTVIVMDKSTGTKLHESKIAYGTQYECHPCFDTAYTSNAFKYLQTAYDTSNDVIYTIATDTSSTDDTGILKIAVSSSDLSIVKYYSGAVGNPTGLLPNPDQPNGKVTWIWRLSCNAANQRLYIDGYCTASSGGSAGDYYLSVMNLTTEALIESYSNSDGTYWEANYPSVDSALIKVLPTRLYNRMYNLTGSINNDNKEYIFAHDTGSGNRYFFDILQTEGLGQRIYYRRTSDDSIWTTAAFLTSNTSDSFCNLGYSDSRLRAFWNRDGSSAKELRWDEDLSTAINVSEYVRTFEINMTDETGANNASITFADKDGIFNPLNYSSLKYDYFLENNIISISKGNAGGVVPAFTGLISSGESRYTRGTETLYSVRAYDKSKNWFKSKITSPFYENKTIDYIVENIITTYGDLDSADYDLPTIGEIIPKVQFIEEYIMDILYKLYQAYGYFPYFDEEGILKARKINYDAVTDYTYYEEGTDTVAANKSPAFNIIDFNHTWSDDTFVNTVTVIGQTEETYETVFDEEFMGFIQGAAGWFSTSNTFTFYFSDDKQLKAVNPRLSVVDSATNKFFGGGESLSTPGSGKQAYCTISQNTTNLVAALYASIAGALVWTVLYGGGFGAVSVYNGLAPVVAIALSILGQISNFYYEIYASPVGEAAPRSISVTVEDEVLVNRYGTIEKEIDNPFLETDVKCRNLANFELEKASWFRYQPQLKILSNMAHQTQDIIEVYNPATGISYKMYIKEIRRSYARGEEDIDQLTCALIT